MEESGEVLPVAGRTIAPTDVAQFIRLEQCQRYLRLRLSERALGQAFFHELDFRPQSIPPILTRSGAAFEEKVERAVAQLYWKINFVTDAAHAGRREDDNAHVVQIARELSREETVVLFQPRLRVQLGEWLVRGDVDVLRMERDAAGALRVLIADMKSSTTAKVEHRLQVAFYLEMLRTLFAAEEVAWAEMAIGVMYRGPADEDAGLSGEEIVERARQRDLAEATFNTREGLLEIVVDPESYLGSVRDLVTGPNSVAAEVSERPLNDVPYHLTYKCDGCLYNEFCMRSSAERDDLSLLPHLTPEEKSALQRAGISTMRELARLKDQVRGNVGGTGNPPRDGGRDNPPVTQGVPVPVVLERPDPRDPTIPADGAAHPPHANTLGERDRDRHVGTVPTPLEGDASVADTTADTHAPGVRLVTAEGRDVVVRRLASSWPVGPRLDELIYRARRYRKWKKDPIEAVAYLPSQGYGSLPYSDEGQNPNLVRVYIDAQHDYLQDRLYMLGALVAASENGREPASRRRSIVRLLDGPPDTADRERALLIGFVRELMRAIVELAAPDAEGNRRAPIHLVFFNHFEQRLLLDALARHFTGIMEATPLYDFVTQLAAFDSPVATFLDQEIRELKNYPMVCQSLQAVAAYLRFDWNAPAAYRDVFHTRMFDFWRKFDEAPREGEVPWYTARARFSSQIPLEYAYAAWNQLPDPSHGAEDGFAGYRGATPELLRGFHARRLEALEWVAKDFRGNHLTQKRPYDLPDLDAFDGKAQTLAQALDKFLSVERHVELAGWKARRQPPPERRVLAGETLIVRYREEDQDPETAERNRENARRRPLKVRYRAEYREQHPDAKSVRLTNEQKAECEWSQKGMVFRLRIECEGTDCDLDEALALTSFREGDGLVLYDRWTFDSRLPEGQRELFQPTPRQMLYGMRARLRGITVDRTPSGRARRALAEAEMQDFHAGGNTRGYTFGTIDEFPLVHNAQYTLDPDPNDWYGYFCAQVIEKLVELEAASSGGNSALYDRLVDATPLQVTWPPEAAEGQRRFLDGLGALRAAGAIHPFDDRQREYIGGHGADPTLLVQGPPGTGKSYSTAFAVFARLQGAMAANIAFRVAVCAKTHAATDVLLKNIIRVRDLLMEMQGRHPEIVARYFDERLLQVPLFRVMPRRDVPAGVKALVRKEERKPGEPRALDALRECQHCITAVTPGGAYRILKDRGELFGQSLCRCLVLDEASQMSLPEAVMAALLLDRDGQLLVVGDHRQMPPIVKHDWSNERARTFGEFRSYESLFLALGRMGLPMVKLAESFRLHADMAEFLRREIYHRDGIPFFSRQEGRLRPAAHADPFVAAVLDQRHTIVVVVHSEESSMHRNEFERRLVTPVLEALSEAPYGLDARHGLGVVVPHRAQRADLRDAIPQLNILDPRTGAVSLSAVDTVERFQGDERDAILVSATESDRGYLLLSSEFLLDPRRLTVALSRARHKMILVASRSVFSLFSPDEETFEHSQLWKNLLRRWCTQHLWEGARDGHTVQVWGNPGREEPVPQGSARQQSRTDACAAVRDSE